MKTLSRDYLISDPIIEGNPGWWKQDADIVAAAARLINILLTNDSPQKGDLISWLTGPPGAGAGYGVAIRRSAVACLAMDINNIETVLEKLLQQFGDPLYIRHCPSMLQEGKYLFASVMYGPNILKPTLRLFF